MYTTVQVAINGKFLMNGTQSYFTVSKQTALKHAKHNQILPPRMYTMASSTLSSNILTISKNDNKNVASDQQQQQQQPKFEAKVETHTKDSMFFVFCTRISNVLIWLFLVV